MALASALRAEPCYVFNDLLNLASGLALWSATWETKDWQSKDRRSSSPSSFFFSFSRSSFFCFFFLFLFCKSQSRYLIDQRRVPKNPFLPLSPLCLSSIISWWELFAPYSPLVGRDSISYRNSLRASSKLFNISP